MIRYGECDYSHLSKHELNIFIKDIDYYCVKTLFPDLEKTKGVACPEGVLQWIGTNSATSLWTNPYKSRLVDVKASFPDSYRSLNDDEGYCEFVKKDVTGKSVGGPNTANSWISIDLKNYEVIPTGYRICNTRTGNCHPRNWNLEASNDEKNWKVLVQHLDDNTLTDTNFILRRDFKVDDPYRYFRINQVGFSNTSFHHLSCCCFEIYGTVFEKKLK